MTITLTPDLIKGFSAAILALKYDEPKPIPDFHMEMWGLCCSDYPKVAIAAPRYHAKSTAITFAYVLANILFRNARHILILSANEELASQFLNQIKTALIENEVIIDRFQVKTLLKEAETEVIVEFKDGHKARILAKGAGQRMRGLLWDHVRPDLVVVDDIEDDELVLNQDRREKFKRWFYAAVMPLIKSGGKMRIVGTIVHQDSLLEGLMPKISGEGSEKTVITPLKTYSLEKNPTWNSVKYRAHDTSSPLTATTWLWEENKQKPLMEYADYKDHFLLDLYSQEYLNEPLDESTAYFKSDWFKESHQTEEWVKRSKRYYAAIDFAVSQADRANYSAICVAALDDTNRLEIVHARRGRWDSKEIMDHMFEVHKRYQPDLFVVEKGTIEKSLGPFLQSESRQRGVYMNLYPLAPTKDKQSRARAIQGRMRMGDVYFDKSNDWYSDFHEELRRFPRGKNDDFVDAFSWIGLALDSMQTAPTKEELRSEWLEEEKFERDKAWQEIGHGVNPVTHY